jgi:hypothetical protein
MIRCLVSTSQRLIVGGHIYYERLIEMPFVPTKGTGMLISGEDSFDVEYVYWDHRLGLVNVIGEELRYTPVTFPGAIDAIAVMFAVGWYYRDGSAEFVEWTKKFRKSVERFRMPKDARPI